MSYVATDCPFCLARHANVEVSAFSPLQASVQSPTTLYASHQAIGTCPRCQTRSLLFFTVDGQGMGRRVKIDYNPLARFTNLNVAEDTDNGVFTVFLGSLPAPVSPQCPEFAPENVEKAFIEAEKARFAEAFTAAAGHYGKAVDRAITPFLKEPERRLTLGQKLGALRQEASLPTAMLEWIDVVKEDRNYALHDEDRDFDSDADVLPTREFAWSLITYLYTMPERVRLAREAAENRKPPG